MTVHIGELRNRVTGAKQWRDQGETQQKAGKIAEAVASYRQSLKLLPDQALEGHVRLLEASLASANQQAVAAGRLWQEGMAFFNQGRYAESLVKFKESLQIAPDAQRAQYVKDLEGRKAKAQTLRDDGYRFQMQIRIPEAVAKYKESLTVWPDAELEKYIRQVEASLAPAPPGGKPTGASASTSPAVASVSQNPPSVASVDPTGTWRHSPEGTWAIAASSNGRYAAEETGLGYARGPAYFTPAGTFRIDYTTRDGAINGYYEVRIAPDGRTATGTVRELNGPRRTGPSNWTRVTPVPRQPQSQAQSTAAPAPTGQWTGAWKSENRADGEVFFALTQNGSRVTGTYKIDMMLPAVAGGSKEKLTQTGSIDGTLAGNRLAGRFKASDDTKSTGTIECTMLSDGNSISVTVRSESTSESWTGRRVSAGTATQTTVPAPTLSSAAVTAEITNRSKMNAHIFLEGESFGPANRFAPGESRRVKVAVSQDGKVVFKAGRDGQVLATKAWLGDPAGPNRVPVVIFDDTNPYEKLVISTGLR